MEKPADTNHEVMEEVKERWSPRAFDPEREVEREKLKQLFAAARWAPSSYNEQPARYIVASKHKDPETYEKLLDCLIEFNQSWAKTAPVLAISVGKTYFGDDPDAADSANEHYQHDIGAASLSLSLQATKLGLFVHQMAGIDEEAIRQNFDIPKGFQPVTALAIGYQDDNTDSLPEDLAEQETTDRERKPQSEFVFRAWDEPAEL